MQCVCACFHEEFDAYAECEQRVESEKKIFQPVEALFVCFVYYIIVYMTCEMENMFSTLVKEKQLEMESKVLIDNFSFFLAGKLSKLQSIQRGIKLKF